MPDRNINPAADEVALLLDIAASLRILSGRKPIKLDEQFPAIPEEPVVEIPKEEKPVDPPRKAGRPKTKTGAGGGA